MAQIPSDELENLGTVQNAVLGFENSGAVEENYSIPYKLPLTAEPVEETSIDGLPKKPINDDGINFEVDSSSLSLKNEEPKCDEDLSVDDISGVILETFIVGRRFSDEKELNLGASISLLRDPDNVKDPNAIKVYFLSAFA